MERTTPLYACHQEWGGKIVPFAGYLLPVQYETGVIREHMAVRTAAGLFDVSHMAELELRGPDALGNINRLVTNDCTDMALGQVRYSPMCNERGGVVDDLVVCRMGEEQYMLVVNAANHEKDRDWIAARLLGDVRLTDLSDTYAQIALQGPQARPILKKLCLNPDTGIPKKYYTLLAGSLVADIPCIVSRTGYTGELGYELYCAPDNAPALWTALLAAGEAFGLIPCGLGARDTLRLEAAMPLYGHEMTDDITPLEAGLAMFVKLEKPDFIGRAALLEKGEPKIRRVGLRMTGRGIAREQCPVLSAGATVGWTTSGTFCPYINMAVAMAYVPAELSAVGTALQVDVRGRAVDAEVVPLPFYKRS